MTLSRRLMLASGAAAVAAYGTHAMRTASAQTKAQSGAQPPRPAQSQSMPRGTATTTDVRLGDTVFSANDPAAIWQTAGAETQRIFLRKGNFAVIWYLQAASPVDGKPFDVVVIERQRWTNLAAEMPAANYQATLFGRSFSIYGHGDFQRWSMSSRPWPMTDRVIEDWQKQGWLLPWGVGPKLSAPADWGYMDPVPNYTPLSKGGMTPAMGTTGLRDEVGPIVHRQARYIMDRSGEMRRIALNYGLTSASIPWHVRGADGTPLLLDDPRSDLKLQQYYQNYPEEKIISISPGMQIDWQIDNAHRPCLAFLPALMTGLHPYFVEQQVFSACAALNSVAPLSRGPNARLVDEGQGRDWAWSMRDMVLAHALLQSMPRVDWLPRAERFDAIISANLDRAMRVMAKPGLGSLGMFWATIADDGTPSANMWAARQTGGRDGVFPGGITNYAAFTLDWGRRLHPDPRWLQLQMLYAQRFQAQRVIAMGPYAFLSLPAKLQGRWASNWAEVARTLRLPANVAQMRWSQFNRPIADPAVYDYETEQPAMVYNGLKLAQAAGQRAGAGAGQAGADVDQALAIIEAQMRGGAESWPAFAMRHGG
jgi:hypothetical protein